ncbi:3-deoxy-7-phosphoheptulonate synthase [Streptomyces paludis]|uniref:Phospho-2-dehydro-3-deoxyheptonate aldolase n=1 Tax=Streptomyces paludis TaxID=2282738 RepID=A0A345HY49_9ACTN|nr:3-deoxy-7-phosphoheptulonate synthase class II [Streptomyces paludis]AXG81623.1 3-deoxy-7-phosphoheptulonate synthase [Streptomyces paludis]
MTPLLDLPSAHAVHTGWRSRPAAQQPAWPDPAALESAVGTLTASAPLVLPRACDLLKSRLAAVARGEAFLVQGGDCAESLDSADTAAVGRTASTLQQLATVFGYMMSLPVVTVARMAGQYAKPRSAGTETRQGVELPVYRGDAVNGHAFTAAARAPDPHRMVRVHRRSGATLLLVRAHCASEQAGPGYALDALRKFAAGAPERARYEALTQEIERAGGFIGTGGGWHTPGELFMSHEGLLLDYESALTRVDTATGRPYATSGHLLWIGERTRLLGGAHVEYFSRISNPVAVKVGPGAEADDLMRLIDRLSPGDEPGRLTLVARMGAGRVREVLPGLVERVAAEGRTVAWVSDPMHGNTIGSPSGHKTRRFDDILDELAGFFEVLLGLGAHPGGVHLEMTGDDVTECVGGGAGIGFADLPERYRSVCDPRLNRDQSLDLAYRLADLLDAVRPPGGVEEARR